MYRSLKATTALAIMMCAFAVHAETAIQCDDCTPSKREELSKAGGAGDYYFWDFKNHHLHHLMVSGPAKAATAIGARDLVAKEVPLTANEQALFDAGLKVYEANGKSAVIAHKFAPVTVNITADKQLAPDQGNGAQSH